MNSGNIESDVSAEKIGKAILSLGKKLEDAVAIGMCGSLARDDFHERSDIDIFVIVKERLVDDRIWWDRRSDVLQDFGRGDHKVWSAKNLKFAQRLTLEVKE
jgi:predicted nucleotidyltransferase